MNKQGIGFLTIAQNTATVDYLRLAYLQALVLRKSNPQWSYAVIVDKETNKEISKLKLQPFDHIITLEHDYNPHESSWKLANECQIFQLTPFKETFKIEADLLLPKTIKHFLPTLRTRDLVLSNGCKTIRGDLATSRAYRKFFDENALPDLYSGLMYFRYSEFAASFFKTAKNLFFDWQNVKNYALKHCREDTPSTDVLFSLTAAIMGVENCCLPTYDCFTFVHMKSAINGWLDNYEWHHQFIHEFDSTILRINNLNQLDPVHYHSKSFIDNDIIKYFEDLNG